MRAVDGSGELPVASYELFSDTEVLGRMAMERMLAGLSTRRYPVGLEPVGARTEQTATATSKSAVSRRFIATTEARAGRNCWPRTCLGWIWWSGGPRGSSSPAYSGITAESLGMAINVAQRVGMPQRHEHHSGGHQLEHITFPTTHNTPTTAAA
jgi:hypothetical protein